MDKHSHGNGHSPSSRWKRTGIKSENLQNWRAILQTVVVIHASPVLLSLLSSPCVFPEFQIRFLWFSSLVLTSACFNVTWISDFDYQYQSLLSCYPPCLPACVTFQSFLRNCHSYAERHRRHMDENRTEARKNSRRTKKEWRGHQITGKHTN